MLKPQLEREAACISIWHRLVTTMVENVCNPQATYEAENEGIIIYPFLLLLFNQLVTIYIRLSDVHTIVYNCYFN